MIRGEQLGARVLRGLSHEHGPRAVIALALLLALPSLAIGFFADDWVFIDALEGRAPFEASWWDLYRFTPDDAAGITRAIAVGRLPWWTAPTMRVHLLRPLASALLTLDHAVFGRNALGYHLHSWLWYAALLVAAGAFFRAVLPRASATLALLLFALADASVFPYAWPSARHGLVAATFVALALIAHVRARRDGWQPGKWLAPLALSVGLLAGESALGGFAFALAYDLFVPAALPTRKRLRRALPIAALALVYLTLYALAGCGARGSDGYVSPLSDPRAFLTSALIRVPVLLADAIVGVPAEVANMGFARLLALTGALATLLLALLWRACRPALLPDERAALRWLVPGALGAMLVAAGGFPGSRELLIANFGFAPLLAAILQHAFAPGRSQSARRTGAGLLVLVHIVLAPASQLVAQLSARSMERESEAVASVVAREAHGSPRIFVIAASDPMAGNYAAAILASRDSATMPCWGLLSGAKADLLLTRTGRNRFSLETPGTTFLRAAFETLYRASAIPLRVGDEREVCGARVRVSAMREGRPARIEVNDGSELGAAGAAWFVWRAGTMSRFAFPALGETLTIPWTPGPGNF